MVREYEILDYKKRTRTKNTLFTHTKYQGNLNEQNKQMISYLLCVKKNGCFLETKLDVIVKSSKLNNLVHFFLCNFGGESSGRRLNRSKSLPARDETLLINGRITRGVQWIRPLQNIIDPILHREPMVGKNKKPSSELLC